MSVPGSGSQPPAGSASFGTVRNDAEGFGTVRNASASFGSIPKSSERKENHTLTVREVARMFEAAGVARTERSIVNWCQANLQGISRLDAYFDPNEHKYFITPQSVELAIREEQAKAAKTQTASEPVGTVPKPTPAAETATASDSAADSKRVQELEAEVLDLKITNRAKDLFIGQLKSEREQFALEREGFVDKLITATRKVGELETRLLQLQEAEIRDAPVELNRNVSEESPSLR